MYYYLPDYIRAAHYHERGWVGREFCERAAVPANCGISFSPTFIWRRLLSPQSPEDAQVRHPQAQEGAPAI